MKPNVCHMSAGDRCRDCREGNVHWHANDRGSRTLYRDGRRDPNGIATLIEIGYYTAEQVAAAPTFGSTR